MDDPNRRSYPGEEHHYAQSPYPPNEKIRPPRFWLPSQRLFVIITTTLLAIVVIFGVIIVHLLTTPSSQPVVLATPTIVTTPLQPVTTTTTAPSPPIIATPTPTPTLTSCPQPCTVYQENGSDGWQGWSLASDWRIVDNNKLLSSDGSSGSNQTGPSAIPPYSLPQGTQNFAIEVAITIPQGMAGGHVSITACGSTATNGWQGYEGVIASGNLGNQAQIYAAHDQIAHTDFSPNQGLYTYRLEVKGNIISLFVNGGLVVQATDNKFLPCGSQIGVVSSLAVVHLSSFKVILL